MDDFGVTFIEDGMDQAKFRIPRTGTHLCSIGMQGSLVEHSAALTDSIHVCSRNLPAAKSLQDLQRPSLHFAGCITHGYEEAYTISPSDTRKDPNAELEVLNQAMERVTLFCDEHKCHFPKNIFIQADNCSREMKNQTTLKYGIALLLLFPNLISFTWNYLRVGHTHEDMGTPPMFGTCGRMHA
jgi:hypothetical protein